MNGGWVKKRFWQETRVEPYTSPAVAQSGFAVFLDQRMLKTPAKAAFVVPTRALAEAIAAEWHAQEKEIRPETMPMTRTANSAIDTVAHHKEAVIDELAGYGASDLLCYWADFPTELMARQKAAWEPVLEWAAQHLAAPLRATQGIVYQEQDPNSLRVLRQKVSGFDAFSVAGLHDLVAISGSLILALAVAQKHLSAEKAFALSRIDEHWQIEQWGVDDEATKHEKMKKEAFLAAERFLRLCDDFHQ